MIGIVIVTHGRLAEEFIHATEHVVGPQKNIRAVCIAPTDKDERRQDIVDAVAAVDAGKVVIILTDLFGGTPSNPAISILRSEERPVGHSCVIPFISRLSPFPFIKNSIFFFLFTFSISF